MDWDKLKTFYAVASCGSITAAQPILNLCQSAISRQIIDLENRLNTSLFKRNKQGMALTDSGKLLYLTTEETYKKFTQVEAQIQKGQIEPQGHLKIASAAGWVSTLLLNSLDDFSTLFPHINLSIITTDYNPKFHLREVDVAILSYIPHQNNLIQDYLMDFHLNLYASQSYLDKFGTPQNVEDLDNHRLLTFGEDQMLFASTMDWALCVGRKGKLPRTPFLKLSSGILLHQAASQGLGIVTLADENYFLQQTPLVRVLPDVTGPILKAYYIYSKEMEGASTIIAFRDHLREVIKKKKWV